MPRREFEPGIEGARALDAADELSSFRRQFELPKQRGRALTYLCGHSLGLMPRRARRYVDGELEHWAKFGVDAHFAHGRSSGWFDYHERFSAPLAALVGAQADEVVAMNSLTVNLHLMLVSFFQPTRQRYKILIERDAFPSDRYAVQSQLQHHGLHAEHDLLEIAPDPDSRQLDFERFRAVLEEQGERIALVLLPGVQYLTGERLDIAALTAAARRFGCRVGFDLAHAIGNVPLALHADGPDFAVWCSYKYLNAGPGAVGGCFVHERWAQARNLSRFAGWWGHDPAQRFKMPREFAPMTGAQGWQLSNPPILALAPLAASLELFQQAGLPKLRRKSERLTRYLEQQLAEQLGDCVTILTPADRARRGCQLSLQLNPAPRGLADLVRGLGRSGVVADLREPDVLRLAPVPLYNSFRDVFVAVRALDRLLGKMSSPATEIAIIGGGPAGSLLAILLARRHFRPVVIERSARFSERAVSGGRSINLALAARGIEALRRAGIDADVAELLIPMRGRMLHDPAGKQRFLAYGQRTGEQIYSISRAALNTLLYRLAAERYGVEYRFEHRCVGIDTATGSPLVQSASGTAPLTAHVVLAADGAGSDVRRALTESGAIEASEELLDHGYKELTIPAAGAEHGFVFEPKALHIWPRGGFMLIALPNPDHSFTATLFLPHRGDPSFASIGADTVRAFFQHEFPDVTRLMPSLDADYANHVTGVLGSVYCRPWSFNARILLVGDAAHAIVPFHGQGMNAAFEDCIELDRLIGAHENSRGCDWAEVFAQFEQQRAPDTRAIAEMAIENYLEMRDQVRDPKFQLRGDLSFELERRFPARFIPRYSMVMFHPEISYAEAQRRGAIQTGILNELTRTAAKLGEVDFSLAARLIESAL